MESHASFYSVASPVGAPYPGTPSGPPPFPYQSDSGLASPTPSSTRSTPQPHDTRQHARSLSQQQWEEILRSKDCPQGLMADPCYISQVSTELERRARADEHIHQLPQHAQRETAEERERERRLSWAQQMIMTNPLLSAEVFCTMFRRHQEHLEREQQQQQQQQQQRQQHQRRAPCM
ncbi:hypothetical protein BDY21DRAFT_355837 [Lineolata rhizophorae]|uniref:Uncharacterized protein n=1 Tax=Lineolata rhizophorae TaxID=578093 RepID=A0A6A6NPI9_9PEZI|nr:hypothetical protein BDY21DRAFT_355837 [Lineolata rhizophorae]